MPAKMTLGEMAKALNRPAVYLTGLQRRFELPVYEGAGYKTPISPFSARLSTCAF